MKHLLKKNSLTIRGAGGGGGGAPAPPGPVAVQMYPAVLAPPLMGQTNYISSFSYAEIVDLISDGPIEGLVNQDNKKVYGQDIFEGIFLNGVPVKETSRINSEELDIFFLKQELKDFWQINEDKDPLLLNKNFPSKKIIDSTSSSLINNPFFSGPISITSYHPEDSLFELANSLNLNLDSIKLAERAFDVISINDERPFLTIINIPTFTVPIADFKFDKSFFGLTDKTHGLDLEISNIGQYIYFTVDSENLNSNQYSEIPRTFIKYNGYSQPALLKNNISPLLGYSAQKFDNVNIYIWGIYGKYGIKDVSKAIDRYFNKITIRQRLPGQYNYNLIKSEFKNGAEVQYPLQNFKNVEIDIQHDKELIGPFKIKNNQKVTSAKACNAGGVTRLTDLTVVEENFPVITNLENETSDDVRYIKNWPIEYDTEGNPLIISNINFNYAVFDKTSQNRTEQPAIPVVHYIDNNNVEEVYVSLTLNNLSDTNHIDLTSAGYGTKPGYTEEPYKGTLTYAELINQNALTNAPIKIQERYIVGVNIAAFIPWATIFPLGIRSSANINPAQYPFLQKFAIEVNLNSIKNKTFAFPTKSILFGINLDYLQNESLIVNNLISIENLNSLLEKYYLYNNVDFQTFLSNFDNGKLIGYSKIVDLTIPYEEFTLTEAKTSLSYNETDAFNVFTSSEGTAFGNGIYLAKNSYKNTSIYDYVFKYKLTPKEVNTNLTALPSRSSSNLSNSLFNRKQQITAGTKLPAVVSIRIDTGYETNENSNYSSSCDFFSYKFDIYGLANDPSKIDIGRRGYDFLRGQRSLGNPRAGVYAVSKADSVVKFHIFKVTESGKASDYYISNSRDVKYNSISFASLSPFSYLVEAKEADLTGDFRVYYPTGEEFAGDLESCFSGILTGAIICGSENCYICEVCTLDENGMFGLQTSGYLSAQDFETQILLDGGLKIPPALENSMFDNFKLNMSTAIPELKKINYLSFSNYSSPYNFIECSYSVNSSINCYNVDTYKFNDLYTNTCVQVCSFDVDVYNVFSDNNKVAEPKTSYSFSIFRVNGDISRTQLALNNLGYKYAVLNINEDLNKYVLVNLPDEKKSNADVIKIIETIGNLTLGKSTKKLKNNLSVLACKPYGPVRVNVPSDSLNDANTFQSKIFTAINSANACKYYDYRGNYMFFETATEEFSSNYFVTYLPFYYSKGTQTTICEKVDKDYFKSIAYWAKYTSHDSAISLRGYGAASNSYFETDWTQDASNITPSINNCFLKSFLLSISNDQNVADLNSLVSNFENIKWIARSNLVSQSVIKVNNYCFQASMNCICYSTNPSSICKINCKSLANCIRAENSSEIFVAQLASALNCQPICSNDYYLRSEIAASNVFTIPVVARNEIASPIKAQAISITANFWVLYNPSTSVVSVVFSSFSKENNWNELQDQEVINKLPINRFLQNLPSTIGINGGSYNRPEDFLILKDDGQIGYSNNSFSAVTKLTYPHSRQNSPNGAEYGSFVSLSNNFGYGPGVVNQVCTVIGKRDYPNTDKQGVIFHKYQFKNNFSTPSLDVPNKNLKIIERKMESGEDIIDVVSDLLKSTTFGVDAIPADAIFSKGSPKSKVVFTNTSYMYAYIWTPPPPMARGTGGYVWKLETPTTTQTLEISFYQIPVTNFSTNTQNIYSNDAGQQILLPPPKLDLSGSPIRRYVKITKLSYETLSPLISKRISVGTVTEIIPQTFSYPFSAIVGTKIDARSFAQMPSRSFHCKLKKVLVPSNYYPNNPKDESDIRYDVTQVGLHKIYDGDWDGTFKLMWTDNPAWILMDMLVNKRYGLGNHIAPEQIDIWELYQVARWCDGVDDDGYYYGVPDSYGGVEPRHTFNALIGDKFNVFDMINQIASVFRGHVYYMNSLITFDDDRPKPPIGEFTNADVKDGLFNYANMKKDDEFTVVEVAFVDAKNDYRSSIEYVENADAIRKRGILKKQMNAFGVTSRGQARRIGKHFLHQSSKENLNVSFTTDMKALLYKPGDLITIHDELLNSYKNFGSVKAIEEVPNSGDLFKVVIDQTLNSGIYNDGSITLYSAMTKPTYSDMQNYLCGGTSYEKVTIDFLQSLIPNLQEIGQKIRNESPRSFAIKNGVNSNQIIYGCKFGYSWIKSPYAPINWDYRAKKETNRGIIDYLEYLNSNEKYFDSVFYNSRTLNALKPIFSIKGETIIPLADVGFGCLAAPNNYLFPPFLASIDNKVIANPCRIFGKDCLFILMNSGQDYTGLSQYPACNLSKLSYITYPCSDMEIYTSRISGLPVYVETGDKIKSEVCFLYPSGNKIELFRSNDFLFTGSLKFKYHTYDNVVYITGKHQLCDYTKPQIALNDDEYRASVFSIREQENFHNLNYFSQEKGFIVSRPNQLYGSAKIGFAKTNPIACYNIMSDSFSTKAIMPCLSSDDDLEFFNYLYSRYTVSGLSQIPQDHKIFFPALMYFCVSENKTSYYLNGMTEVIECIPISLRYVENDMFCDLFENELINNKLKGHWLISVGTGFSDVLELDWIDNESEKIKSNIYDILNNSNCFRFSKLSGVISGEPIYCCPTGYNKDQNPFTGFSCCRFLHEEPFEQRSGIYSGFNNLYLFSQMTGVNFILNYPHPSDSNLPPFLDVFSPQISLTYIPKIIKNNLNNTYLSGIRELLCQCFNLGKPYYPVYNTGIIDYISYLNTQVGALEIRQYCNSSLSYTGICTSIAAQQNTVSSLNNRFTCRKIIQNLHLDEFQNFTPRMIIDFTGLNLLPEFRRNPLYASMNYDDVGSWKIDPDSPIKYHYSYFQRTFAHFYTGLITTENLNNFKYPSSANGYSSNLTTDILINGWNTFFSIKTKYFVKDINGPSEKLISFNAQTCRHLYLCCDYFPHFCDIQPYHALSGKYLTQFDVNIAYSKEMIISNPYFLPNFQIETPDRFYSYVCCTSGYESNLDLYIIPQNANCISYSKIVENDRPSVELFLIHDYITGYNQASGFDQGVSTNVYTELYLCKTNDFGVTKDSVRNGLGNFCIGSLYSLQILNKTSPTFKIMSITENYINEYNIFATQYKEEKFLEIEENVRIDSLENTFNALYYYQSASRLTQKNEPLKSPIIKSIDYVRYSNAPTLNIKWVPASEHIEGYTQYRIYVQSPSKQTPNLQAIVGDNAFDRLNNYFEYNYQGDGIANPLEKEVGNYTISVEAFYEKDGVYVFSTPTKRSINIINY
jgi:hypothetical protein